MKRSVLLVVVLLVMSLSLVSCNSTKMAYIREDYLQFKAGLAGVARSSEVTNALCVAAPASVLFMQAMGM